jgi:hypothetical protein
MIVPKAPRWPTYALATWELRDYRQKLESALRRVPEDSADRTLIQTRLREVTAEQDERAQVTTVPGNWGEP